MKTMHRIALSLALALMSAVPRARGGVAHTPESYHYGHNDGATKVPTKEGCPDFGTNHTAEQRDKTYAMGQLAADSYKDGTAQPPEGYTTITDRKAIEQLVGANTGFEFGEDGTIFRPNDPDGFNAVLYQADDGSIVLAFRGTEATSTSDWLTDKEQLAGRLPSQYRDATFLLGRILENTRGEGTHIDVTGHSLGGGLTQYALATNDLEGRVDGYTFNSAGLSDETIARLDGDRKHDASGHLTNIRQVGDTVSAVGWHLGDIYDVPDHDRSFIDHSIGGVVGTHDDGSPRYDGFLGNLYTDNRNNDNGGAGGGGGGSDSGGGVIDAIIGFFEGAWDWARWLAGGKSDMEKLVQNAGTLYNEHRRSPPTVAAGECPCGVAEHSRMLNMLAADWREWQRAYGAVNGWAAVAYASKTFGESMGLLFSALEPPEFDGIGSTILGRVNDYILKAEETGEWTESLALSQLGDVKALGEALREFSKLKWEDCKTADEKAHYLQLVLDIRGEVRKLGDTNAVLSSLGLGSETAVFLNDFLKKTDGIADTAQTFLDGYRAASEASKYFSNVSEAMEVLAEMERRLPQYEKRLAELREAAGTCSCDDSCSCVHCRKNAGIPVDPGEQPPYDEWRASYREDDEDPWKPILVGIRQGDGTAHADSELLDVIGLGQFSEILDRASDVAGWLSEAGIVAQNVSGLAEGLWNVVSSPGGIADAIGAVGNRVVAQLDTWLGRISGRISAWLNARAAKIADWIEKYTGPIAAWMGDFYERWRQRFAADVSGWLDTMREYSERTQYERTLQDSAGWSIVDFGADGGVEVDGTGRTLRSRKSEAIYQEEVGQ